MNYDSFRATPAFFHMTSRKASEHSLLCPARARARDRQSEKEYESKDEAIEDARTQSTSTNQDYVYSW